jgi:hypothetical protein
MGGVRRTEEQVMAEFHWLYDCFESFNAAYAPLISLEEQGFRDAHIVSRREMLGWLDRGQTPSRLVSGVRSGLRDHLNTMKHLPKDNPAHASMLMANYLTIRGRTLFEDVALAKEAQA